MSILSLKPEELFKGDINKFGQINMFIFSIVMISALILACNTTAQEVQAIGPKGDTVKVFVMNEKAIVFCCTDGVIYRSADRGTKWVPLNFALPPETRVNHIAVAGNELFASTSDHVFHSMDVGESWATIDSGLPPWLAVSCFEVYGADLYAGTTCCGVYVLKEKGNIWLGGAPNPAHVSNVVFFRGDLYLSTYNVGVYRGVLNEKSVGWQHCSKGLPSYVISLKVNGSTLFAETLEGRYRLMEMNNEKEFQEPNQLGTEIPLYLWEKC